MIWYGIIGVSVVVVVVYGKVYLEVLSLRKLVQKQNMLLKKNLAELRDEYARLNRAVKKEKDKKTRKN